MSNEERIKRRIARSKEKRRIKHLKNQAIYGNFDSIITMQNYYDALKKCLKGVHWKPSVQKYEQHGIINIYETVATVSQCKIPPLKWAKRIVLYERGKRREIVPIVIGDRITQRVICDNSLVPMIKDKLIYDNGASTKGKGVHFARNRLQAHLNEAARKWKDDFWILVFDFKNFFGSIPHKTCKDILEKLYDDKRIVQLIMDIVLSYHIPHNKSKNKQLIESLKRFEGEGICLGSQISQILALVVPNQLDHYVKDKMSVRNYMRYMDDGVIFSNDKTFLIKLYEGMKDICKKLGLTFNEKKTRIVKATKGFTFMKVKYRVSNGIIIKKLARAGIVRMRRKLKRFYKLVQKGKMNLDDVYNSIQSWFTHSKIAHSYKTVKSIMKLYNELFDGYKLTNKWKHMEGSGKYALLQVDKWQEYYWDSNSTRICKIPA